MKEYKIVSVRLTHPSFSWGNGLYAVIENDGETLRMCKINNEGRPETFKDGRFITTCTGTNNKEVYQTSLILKY